MNYNRSIIKHETIFSGEDAAFTSAAIDVGQWSSFSLQVNYSNTGTLKIQGGNDGANWVDLPINAAGDTSITMTTSPELINFVDVNFRYIRVDIAGSVTGASGILLVKA